MSHSTIAFLRDFPPLGVFQFELEALESIELPPYAGSAWRGLLGHGLRRAVCVTRAPRCDGCLLFGTCVYSRVFESPPSQSAAPARSNALPHPYVVVVDAGQAHIVSPGDGLSVGVHLIGDACASVPYLVHAMTLAGERGIGRQHGRFALRRVWQLAVGEEGWHRVYGGEGSLALLPSLNAAHLAAAGDPPRRLVLRLLTPLRIKRGGSLVGPRELEPGEWVRQLVWRLNDLSRYYGAAGTTLRWADVQPLVETLRLEGLRVRWQDWTRHSSRQDTLMQLGGLIGDIHLAGEGLTDLWPLLRLGQWVHFRPWRSSG